MKYDRLKPLFQDKRAVILGLGREGRNWLDIIRGLHCCREIAVADINPLELEIRNVTPISGDNYLEICKKSCEGKSDSEQCYRRLLFATDCVCGMTDGYAKDFYHTLKG